MIIEPDQKIHAVFDKMKEAVKEELNVKSVRVVSSAEGYSEAGFTVEVDNGSGWQGAGVVGPVSGTAIDTRITPELRKEGLAREVVHRIQDMRKKAGFDIADHIATYYQAEGELEKVMREFAPYIQQETLSSELVPGPSGPGAYQEAHRIDGEKIALAVKRL